MTRDLCCVRCRGPLAMCTDKNCWHHIEKRAAEDKDNRSLHRFNDPTPNGRTGLERRPRTRGRRR